MSYSPGHSYVVRYQVETQDIEESSNGMTAATLPDPPSLESGNANTVVGYTNVPQLGIALGNHIGYSIGSSRGMFTGRGRVEPTINFTLRLGSLDFLTQCVRDANDKLPALALYVGIPGQPSLVFRYAKCGQVQLNFQDSGGGGGGKGGGGSELTAQVQFMAVAVQTDGPILSLNPIQLRALGSPLSWHDVRNLTLGGVDYRKTLMSQQWTLAHNLERKNTRPDWGDDEPLSRTCYDILEHQQTVSGNTQFHNELNMELLMGAKRVQNWGDMSILASDSPTGGTHYYKVTATDVMPQSMQQNETESSAQIAHSVPVVASGLDIALAA